MRTALEELDAGGPGADPARYEAVAETLRELPTPVEMSRLFQLDMIKPGDRPALGGEVLAEIARALEILLRLAVDRPVEGLERFRKDFNERFEGREMPLLQALDEEVGIGYERASDFGAEASPLLRGIALGAAAERNQRLLGARPGLPALPAQPGARRGGAADRDHRRGSRPHGAGRRRGEEEIPASRRPSTSWSPSPRPRRRRSTGGTSRSCSTTRAAPRERGCSAASATPTRSSAGTVETHLRAEEALQPDAIFAEIVHLPEGRIGNILARPVLREYEIPFLGRSGAPPEQQIPVTDLRVSVAGSRVVLRSARLGQAR